MLTTGGTCCPPPTAAVPQCAVGHEVGCYRASFVLSLAKPLSVHDAYRVACQEARMLSYKDHTTSLLYPHRRCVVQYTVPTSGLICRLEHETAQFSIFWFCFAFSASRLLGIPLCLAVSSSKPRSDATSGGGASRLSCLVTWCWLSTQESPAVHRFPLGKGWLGVFGSFFFGSTAQFCLVFSIQRFAGKISKYVPCETEARRSG